MTVHLIVGPPGAGRTTRAEELEVREAALRPTPDERQTAIFDADDPNRWRTQERVDRRERIEGELVEIGMRAARLGLDVVLDFGLRSRDERSALRWMAASLGVPSQVVHLPITLEEQRVRVRDRFAGRPGEFAMTDADLAEWQMRFEPPDEDELRGGRIPEVPSGHVDWWSRASDRWPSLPPPAQPPPAQPPVGDAVEP